MSAKFKIFRSTSDGYYYFRLVSYSDKTLIVSEGYTTKQACLNGVESIKKNSQIPGKFEVAQARNGKYFFRLIAGNGQIIGTSEFFSSKSALEKTLDLVRINANTAEVLDLVY
ncbi:YegP family protein [Flagellimonas halotolerans]|uniref:YegP family protein n=1 Tax=Flagellimonas halotolerans TaxID=3112164 RepID=A0ABU6IN64_9FLAO|nr:MULTISPECIES: YegP family protein [unclassified Allomuricauda]MEC3964548.1 YegP family protein [Muricauda sp. SYSU M86414]MEC4264417.1 YegP family protein [Muricauda sp. SYSU M84420]